MKRSLADEDDCDEGGGGFTALTLSIKVSDGTTEKSLSLSPLFAPSDDFSSSFASLTTASLPLLDPWSLLLLLLYYR